MSSIAGVALASMAASGPASAVGPDSDARQMQAQELAEKGDKLADSDPKRALAMYRASHEIHPTTAVLFSIGRTCARLGDAACAVGSYEQVLRDAGAELTPARRKEIENALKALTKNLGFLTIKADTAGASVKVDGNLVGKTPLAQPVPLAAGAHTVVVVLGSSVVEKSVEIEKGASATLELDLPKENPAAAAPAAQAAAEAPPPAKDEPLSTPKKQRGAPVVPWVITGALAAGTGISAIFLVQASSDYDTIRDRYPLTRTSLEDAHDRGRTFLLLTGALGAATLVSLGVSGVMTLGRRKDAAAPTVGLVVGPGGIGLAGALR